MSDDNNKFKNGKIYTIRYKNDDTLIYVGATVQPLYKRLSAHKKDSKNPRCENILLYKKMNETDINDWFIELFEDCACERKEILNKREGEVIRQIGTLNKRIEGRTRQEWRQDNKDELKEKGQDYREGNKEHYQEYRKINKENIIKRDKEFYSKNKDKINERRRNNRLKKKLEKEEANIVNIS
jgi:hypothetical protein